MKLELIPVPVIDIDRSKAFYTDHLGFAVDVDVPPSAGTRIVQLTPPGSACSIVLSRGLPMLDVMTPGTVRGVHLVVADIEKACLELQARGTEVGTVTDVGGGVKYAELVDPDGNSFVLQEMAWRTGDAY
jgi:catechol 2,3-dioxygenase-like lactoylglutathione lyase family enzyme